MGTEITDAFKAQYRKSYGLHRKVEPDFTRCAKSIHGGGSWPRFNQCSRKNGHGPEGAWCKQHDPVAKEAKSAARMKKWSEDLDRTFRINKLISERIGIIKKIAEGHNDPRGLCLDYLARWNGEGGNND